MRTSRPPAALLFVLLLFVSLGLAASQHRSAGASGQSAPSAFLPFVYANASSNVSYDIMLSDGVSKDRRVARIKVDSVFFGNVAARLSIDRSTTAFRVSGDRLGGSSLYAVDTTSGKYVLIDSSKTAAESIGAFAWSPAGNTLAYVRSSPAPDPAAVDEAYGSVYIFSVGFKAMRLPSSNGNDRVIAFGGDGLGVYVARKEGQYEHLVYLPLSGGAARMVLQSRPVLQFSSCAVLSQPNFPTRLACLAEGNFAAVYPPKPIVPVALPPSTAPIVEATPVPQSKVPVYGNLSAPAGLGIVVAGASGEAPILLRRDAEAFPTLAWKPDGSALIMGGTRTGAAWAVDMAGNRRALSAPLQNMDPVTWSLDGSLVLLSDTPSTRLLSVNLNSGSVAATRYVGVTPKAAAAAVKLPVPYIHQVRDLADNGNGNWACGPTSIAMALAYYKRLEPWASQVAGDRVSAPASTFQPTIPPPISQDSVTPMPTATPTRTPTPHAITGADFAPYVTNKYTAFGHTYSAVARDPSGNYLAGLYGTIAPSGLADWQEMQAVLSWHNLSSQWVSDTWDGIVGALKRGHPVLLGNQLTSEGHIILVIGYTNDGNLIVNDPYGNRFTPGYGGNDGNGILYPWKMVTPRRALEVIGSR